jgi:hypothetical protein
MMMKLFYIPKGNIAMRAKKRVITTLSHFEICVLDGKIILIGKYILDKHKKRKYVDGEKD